jgi:hypothetical protein
MSKKFSKNETFFRDIKNLSSKKIETNFLFYIKQAMFFTGIKQTKYLLVVLDIAHDNLDR